MCGSGGVGCAAVVGYGVEQWCSATGAVTCVSVTTEILVHICNV